MCQEQIRTAEVYLCQTYPRNVAENVFSTLG